MPYSSKAIANYFLEKAKDEGKTLSPMKLLKLVYFAHGWFLAIKGEPLIREQVEAWKFGPVIPSLYHALKEYGHQPITHKIDSWKLDDGVFRSFHPTVGDKTDTTGEVRKLLDKVWDVYSGYSAIQLSNITHAVGSPWCSVYEEHKGELRKGTDIPDDLIKAYFVKQAAKAK